MKIAIVGHRGTGKTSLLGRIERMHQEEGLPAHCLDLDREIETFSQKKIFDIFQNEGVAEFRALERLVFEKISQTHDALKGPRPDLYVVLGAGFELETIGDDWHVIWVRRPSDEKGRIFSDRPRLNKKVEPLAEYLEVFAARQARYARRADEVFILEEGQASEKSSSLLQSLEKDFFLSRIRHLGGAVTILPEQFRSEGSFTRWATRRFQWGVRWFELRDDLLTEEQVKMALRHLPAERVIISFRTADRITTTAQLLLTESKKAGRPISYDWALELGPLPASLLPRLPAPKIISFHRRQETASMDGALADFRSALQSFAPADFYRPSLYKVALPTETFADLLEGHAWQKSQPEKNIFLPLSADGRWAWYRLLRGPEYLVNFWRDGDGSGADQPTLMAWAKRMRVFSENPVQFAAVFGDPVAHSRSPAEHTDFLAERHMLLWPIRLTADEFSKATLTTLAEWGLRWAAVTAPHKAAAFALADTHDAESARLQATNTLATKSAQWRGSNTDLEGFRALIASTKPTYHNLGDIAVWGGGGTLNVIREVLPEAQYFSIRTKENREPQGPRARDFQPRTLVWAAGFADSPHDIPASWQPKLVIDLNYAENSPARALALDRGANYISGLEMFRAQARAQQKIWSET